MREAKSEKKRAANAESGSRPKVWLGPDDRQKLLAIKRKGLAGLGPGIDWLVGIVNGTVPAENQTIRIQAFRELADRCGMPRKTEAEVNGEGSKFKITVEGMDATLGWPGAVAGAAGGEPADGA